MPALERCGLTAAVVSLNTYHYLFADNQGFCWLGRIFCICSQEGPNLILACTITTSHVTPFLSCETTEKRDVNTSKKKLGYVKSPNHDDK